MVSPSPTLMASPPIERATSKASSSVVSSPITIGRRPWKGKRDSSSERFASPGRAVKRVAHDLEALGEYFLSVAKDAEQGAPLLRSVKKELFVLTSVLEFLWAAVGGENSLEEFILFLHKRTGADSGVTKQ